MTPHEIIAIVDLKMQRSKNTKLNESDYEELYEIYLEAKDGCN